MNELQSRIYRHYRGRYYLLTDIVFDEERNDDVIILMDLYSGNKILWERTGFFSEKVNELADNPTGQAMCFEHVKDFNNQLNLISTDNLIKELLRRNDNPFAGIDLDGFKNDKVYLSQYVVGITNYTDTEYGQTESFETYYTCENIESARKYCAKLGGRNKIMKRVYLNIDEQDV